MASRYNGKLISRLRAWHKWPSLIFTIFILLFAFSGIILNHRDLLSSVDVNRKVLPPVYRYNNWNLAAVRGAVPWGTDSILVYGNIGIWLTDTTFTSFTDFNNGFPEGIDNRKIAAISIDSVTGIHAATLFGLYRFTPKSNHWERIPLPVPEERIVKTLSKGDSLMVMTRSNLLVATVQQGLDRFSVFPVPASEDDDGKVGLFKTLWVIHSGEIYGMIGKLIVDAIGVIFIILCITGLIYFFVPFRLNRLKDEFRKVRLKRFNKTSLRWHNSVGSWAILILILTTITGMFLRPPLLIPIAYSRVEKIKYSELDNPNPWFDRFRDLLYDQTNHRWMVATSEGIYHADEDFTTSLKPFAVQPPVSVMGINVFRQLDSSSYLVGSFSGIFIWESETGKVWDYFTKLPYQMTGRGAPFGALSVAGYIQLAVGSRQLAVQPFETTMPVRHGTTAPLHHGTTAPLHHSTREVLFDFMGGAISLRGGKWFPPMPEEVTEKSPISLWNTALEIHTGRIFQPVLGDFYILVVPLVGLFALEISIIGFLAWWVARRRKNQLSLLSKSQ